MVDPRFPSMKARAVLRVLVRDLGYEVVRRTGSHRVLRAPGRPQVLFAFHDRQSVAPGLVHAVPCKQAGLDVDEALRLL